MAVNFPGFIHRLIVGSVAVCIYRFFPAETVTPPKMSLIQNYKIMISGPPQGQRLGSKGC